MAFLRAIGVTSREEAAGGVPYVLVHICVGKKIEELLYGQSDGCWIWELREEAVLSEEALESDGVPGGAEERCFGAHVVDEAGCFVDRGIYDFV